MINSLLARSLYLFPKHLFAREQNYLTAVQTGTVCHLFPASQEQNCLPPVSEHTCVTLLPHAYFGGHVLSQAFLLQKMVHLYIWLHKFAVSLSEQQNHFNAAAFCKIGKNSLSCRSWRDDENVDSPSEPPLSINNVQERMID